MYETIYWAESWLQHSKVHQCWGQEAIHYTVLEAPSFRMNRSWLYQYRNWPYLYTDYSTPFAGNQSLSESMQSLTQIECSLVFLSQETGTDTFSSGHAKFQQVFNSSISLARVAFSLVNLQNVFLLIASGVNTDASTWLLPLDLFLTYLQTQDHMVNFSQCKPPQNTRMRAKLGPFQMVHLQANSGQTESV